MIRDRFGVTIVMVTVLLTIVAFAPDSWAQGVNTEAGSGRVIIDRLDDAAAAGERSREAAEEAIDFRKLDIAPVTYQEVLKDPDNVELNFRFARTQVSQGNFRGASSTLERILRLQPKLAPVRLLYAIVLFQLDNYGEAEREFLTIAALKIDEETRTEIDRFLERIQLARRTTRYAASVSFGLHLDTNRTSAPRSEQLLVANALVTVDGPESDFGYIGVATIRANHDLGYQEGHEVFGSLTYFHDDQTAEDALDLQSFSLEAGGTMFRAFEEIDVTTSLSRTRVHLSREEFLTETGARLRFDRSFGQALSGYTEFKLSNQTFDQISENSGGSSRNGRQFSLAVGGSYLLSGSQLLGIDFQHLDKSSKGDVNNIGQVEKFVSFQREQVSLNHTWLLGGGQFLLNSFTYQLDRYEDPDTVVVGNRTRRDAIYRYRLTYGAPLSFLFGEDTLPEELADITLTPSFEALRSFSNLNNNNYKNFNYQALLTKSWRF